MAVLVAVDHPLDLSAYLYQLYQGQQLCDLILTSTDNTEFYTHRIVMSSASTYLHQLFINHSPIASCIRLDLSTEVLRLLIDFMYTGQLNVTDQVRPQLQHAAISLQIHALEKLLCTKFAESSLSGSCNPARAVSVSQSQTSDWMKLVPERSEDSSFGQISSAGSEPHTKEAASVLDQTFDGENDINSKPTHQQGGHYVKSETRYSEVDKRTSHQVGNISSHSLTAVTSQSVQASSFSSQLLGQDGGGINSEVKQESFLCSTPYSDITGTGVHSGRQEQGSVRRGSREIKKQKGSARQTIAQNWKKNVFVPKSRTRIICDICKATFMSHNTLRCHRLTRHGPNVRENTAAVCLRKCYDTLCHIRRQCEPLVVRGDDMVLDGARYSCKMCSSRFRYYSQCRLHVHRRHSRMENPLPRLFRAMSVTMNRQSGRYRVKEKRRKSPLLTQLKAREEEASKRIDCDKCHKSFSTERTLKDHLARVHKIQRSKLKETNRKVAPSDFQCVKCGRSTSDSQTLIRHLQHVHHLDRQEAKHEADNIPFKMACVEPDCQFCSNNLTDMDSHMTSVHPAVQLTCDQCPKTFTVDISLKRHIITKHKPRHGKSKPFCSLCNKGFMKPYYLKLHEYRKHNIPHPQIKIRGIPLAESSICGTQSKVSDNLQTSENREPIILAFGSPLNPIHRTSQELDGADVRPDVVVEIRTDKVNQFSDSVYSAMDIKSEHTGNPKSVSIRTAANGGITSFQSSVNGMGIGETIRDSRSFRGGDDLHKKFMTDGSSGDYQVLCDVHNNSDIHNIKSGCPASFSDQLSQPKTSSNCSSSCKSTAAKGRHLGSELRGKQQRRSGVTSPAGSLNTVGKSCTLKDNDVLKQRAHHPYPNKVDNDRTRTLPGNHILSGSSATSYTDHSPSQGTLVTSCKSSFSNKTPTVWSPLPSNGPPQSDVSPSNKLVEVSSSPSNGPPHSVAPPSIKPIEVSPSSCNRPPQIGVLTSSNILANSKLPSNKLPQLHTPPSNKLGDIGPSSYNKPSGSNALTSSKPSAVKAPPSNKQLEAGPSPQQLSAPSSNKILGVSASPNARSWTVSRPRLFSDMNATLNHRLPSRAPASPLNPLSPECHGYSSAIPSPKSHGSVSSVPSPGSRGSPHSLLSPRSLMSPSNLSSCSSGQDVYQNPQQRLVDFGVYPLQVYSSMAHTTSMFDQSVKLETQSQATNCPPLYLDFSKQARDSQTTAAYSGSSRGSHGNSGPDPASEVKVTAEPSSASAQMYSPLFPPLFPSMHHQFSGSGWGMLPRFVAPQNLEQFQHWKSTSADAFQSFKPDTDSRQATMLSGETSDRNQTLNPDHPIVKSSGTWTPASKTNFHSNSIPSDNLHSHTSIPRIDTSRTPSKVDKQQGVSQRGDKQELNSRKDKQTSLKTELVAAKSRPLRTNYTCEVGLCGEKFASKFDLDEHMLQVHDVRAKDKGCYLCKLCHETFECKDTLLQHEMKVHHPVCEYCGETFQSWGTLFKHKNRMHIQERQCQICQKVFEAKTLLNRHMKIHGVSK